MRNSAQLACPELPAEEAGSTERALKKRIEELEFTCARLRQDLVERTAAEQRFWHAAHHDPLTGLANRLMLNDCLEHALRLASRNKTLMAVMYMDLDRFKAVNDTLGHEVGDDLLCAVASTLRSTVRAADVVARIGGDEFVIVLHELHQREDALLIADKIRSALMQPIAIGEHRLQAMGSIGIGVFPDHGSDAASLLRVADAAMYQAKLAGRNGIFQAP